MWKPFSGSFNFENDGLSVNKLNYCIDINAYDTIGNTIKWFFLFDDFDLLMRCPGTKNTEQAKKFLKNKIIYTFWKKWRTKAASEMGKPN